MVFSTLICDQPQLSAKKRKLLDSWIGFWKEVGNPNIPDRNDLRHPLVVIVSIVKSWPANQTIPNRKSWWKNILPGRKESINVEEWQENWQAREHDFIHVDRFDSMDRIGPEHVKEWLENLKHQNTALGEVVDSALLQLEMDFPYEGQTMDEFVSYTIDKLGIVEAKQVNHEQ